MALIFSMLVFLMLTSPAAELDCFIPSPPAVELDRAKAVFVGKVIGREYVEDSSSEQGVSGERLIIKIAVERVWKGEIGKEVIMYTSEVRQSDDTTSMMAEDFDFVNEKRYLIYADGTVNRLHTSACTRSREFEKAADDLKELGEGHQPGEKKEVSN